MSLSLRATIINYVINKLKDINNQVSTYDSSYTYHTNLFRNISRGLQSWDKINDYPTIKVIAGFETFSYQPAMTIASLPINLRCYGFNEKPLRFLHNLHEDVDHILRRVTDYADLNILNIGILTDVSDAGLLSPYGILDIVILVKYQAQVI